MKPRPVMVICAHSDDQILGPGGTLAKYASEGREIHTLILSFGEGSHPHLKPAVIKKMRVQESQKADKVLGGKGVSFLGAVEGRFKSASYSSLKRIMREKNPGIIFTHSSFDLFKDHRDTHHLVLQAYDELGLDAKVYSFEVSSPRTITAHDKPIFVVDITSTFRKKIKALNCFKSQINFFSYAILLHYLYITVYVRAFINGISNGCRFAEVFWMER